MTHSMVGWHAAHTVSSRKNKAEKCIIKLQIKKLNTDVPVDAINYGLKQGCRRRGGNCQLFLKREATGGQIVLFKICSTKIFGDIYSYNHRNSTKASD